MEKILLVSLFWGIIFMNSSCTMTPTQSGALGGAGVGAITGQLIGGDTEATLIGAGVGALGGAILNDHIDQQKTQSYQRGYNQGNQSNIPCTMCTTVCNCTVCGCQKKPN